MQATWILTCEVADREIARSPVREGLTIGRSAEVADLFIPSDDADIEPMHARIVAEAGAWRVQVVLAEGTWLYDDAGEAVRQITLAPGVAFRIGAARLTCRAVSSRASAHDHEPWQVRCYRCDGPLDLNQTLHHQTCPTCQVSLFYREHARFKGWLPCRLGVWSVMEVVGAGASSVVLKARSDTATPVAAIKLYRSKDAANHEKVSQEYKALKSIRSPHVPKLVGQHHPPAGTDGNGEDPPWLAMQWVDGESLARILSQHRQTESQLSLKFIGRVVRQLADALEAIHDEDLVHRDLNPANVLDVASDQMVRLVDLGIAADQRVTGEPAPPFSSGTIAYQSPELIRGEPATPRSDIHALGVLWYQMLVDDLQPPPRSAPALARPQACPHAWWETISACLAADPRMRPTLAHIRCTAVPPRTIRDRVREKTTAAHHWMKTKYRFGWWGGALLLVTLFCVLVWGWLAWPERQLLDDIQPTGGTTATVDGPQVPEPMGTQALDQEVHDLYLRYRPDDEENPRYPEFYDALRDRARRASQETDRWNIAQRNEWEQLEQFANSFLTTGLQIVRIKGHLETTQYWRSGWTGGTPGHVGLELWAGGSPPSSATVIDLNAPPDNLVAWTDRVPYDEVGGDYPYRFAWDVRGAFRRITADQTLHVRLFAHRSGGRARSERLSSPTVRQKGPDGLDFLCRALLVKGRGLTEPARLELAITVDPAPPATLTRVFSGEVLTADGLNLPTGPVGRIDTAFEQIERVRE